MKAYLFPGQGSQFDGMGEDLFDDFSHYTNIASEVLGYCIKSLCIEGGEKLNKTEFTQPAVFVVNALSYMRHIQINGMQANYFSGHSLGEFNALYAAGAMSFTEALKIVKRRGELMSEVTQGAMAAVINLGEQDILSCLFDHGLDSIDIANYNSPKQIVISGLVEQINLAMKPLEKRGAYFVPLKTSGAFHSRFMLNPKEVFYQYLREFEFSELSVPVISNKEAMPYSVDSLKITLAEQMTSPVKWTQSIEYMLDRGVNEFLEMGCREILSKFVNDIRGDHLKLHPIGEEKVLL
ncbi:ACP S-malonyltransferase [Agarilytica rhodophyticola]|uniref:ACP S-malonyltransferase n=1 Tax=Agarilytica rhodophyticola TaxID=1737490 RepID=UPI000B3452BC|nr:ACP S-malonyltransferase [Agarilytica rhodophyticola]